MSENSLLHDFIAETGEHLEQTERNLLQLEQQPSDLGLLNEVFRSIHTIKGSSEYLGMERIAELSHQLEGLLDMLRRGERRVDRGVIDLLIDTNDRLGTLVADLQRHGSEQAAVDDLVTRIAANLVGAEKAPEQTEGAHVESYEDEYDEELFGIFVEQLKDGLQALLEEAKRLEAGEPVEPVLERCADRLITLRSSANYMGYEHLKKQYEQWLHSVSEYRGQLSQGETIDARVGDEIIANIERVKSLFPKVKVLQEVELRNLIDENYGEFPPESGQAEPELALFSDGAELVPEHVDVSEPGNPGALPESEKGLLSDFIAETGEHLEQTERNLLQLEQQPSDLGLLNEVFRSIHTIKGSSEYLGMERIAELSHQLEGLLDMLRRGERRVDRGVIDLLIDTNDRLGTLVADLQRHGSEQAAVDDLVTRIAANLVGAEKAPEQTEGAHVESYEDEYDEELFGIFVEQLKDGLQALLEEAKRLDAGEPVEPVLERCADRLITLRSSANYMGYEHLKKQYEQWLHSVSEYRGQLSQGETIDARVGDEIIANIERVKSLFPKVKVLQEVELRNSIDENYDEFPPESGQVEPELALFSDGSELVPEHVDVFEPGNPGALPESEYRLSSTVFAKMPEEPVKTHSSVYEETYDKELFTIFKEHLTSGLQAMENLIPELRSGTNTQNLLTTCLEQLARLRSSANYMGYEELCSFYDTWIENIGTAEIRSHNQSMDLQESTLNQISSNIQHVRSLFETCANNLMASEDLSNLSKEQCVEDMPDHSVEQTMEQDEIDQGVDVRLFSQLENAFEARFEHYSESSESTYSIAIENELLSDETSDDHTVWENNEPVNEDGLENLQEPSEIFEEVYGAEPIKTHEVDNDDRRRSFHFGRRQSDKTGEKLKKSSIRVDASKIDVLMNQVGELVVNRAGFTQLINEMRSLQFFLKQTQKLNRDEMQQIKLMLNRISDATLTLGRVTSELQENVMKVRMLPIAQLFSRYPRLIHDLMRSMNKSVDLEVLGEETELDKMVIEQIADPLVHIIRNAVDHGIEEIEERRRKGKNETGKLRLEAYHEGNFVVIEVSDDGRGIDPAKIRTHALDKGFSSVEELNEMNDQEILTHIMRPGFSTAEQITHTSGRGVGMDVVKECIDKINGSIEIISTFGSGTCFRIKIPLTLAIIPALLVRVAEDVFTIPLANVDETIRVQKSEISTIEGVEIYYLRETTVPLVRLTKVFNMPATRSNRDELFVVILNAGGKRVGLVVDELHAREEVVIKPLEDYLQEKSGFAGATILGDGSISLILDVFELVNLSIDQHARRSELTTSS
jgi:two-component system, chemotaxis family, sensor kinase CheA